MGTREGVVKTGGGNLFYTHLALTYSWRLPHQNNPPSFSPRLQTEQSSEDKVTDIENHPLSCAATERPTGNGKKLSSSEAQLGQVKCLAVA